jgi:WD repeat-containing protein 20
LFIPVSSTSASYGGNNGNISNNTNGNNNTNNNNNHAHVSTQSNGPVVISSNSLSSSATTATVTSLTNELQHENNFINQNNVPNGDWICFNFGKELYTYSYRGVKKVRFKLHKFNEIHNDYEIILLS